MKISINAPSYRRPSHVLTLNYLPTTRIWVDEGEAPAYRDNYPSADIVSVPTGIQGNLCRIRNHILKTEFDRGMDVVLIIDDDLQGIYRWQSNKARKLASSEILPWIEKSSLLAREFGAKFWGINISQDKQIYREATPFSTVSYIGGPFQCFLAGNECFYDERLPLKEDYDMTLQQLNKYRIALRLNAYFYRVKQAEQEGGCATYRNYERELSQLDLLKAKWGSKIVRIDTNLRSHNLKKKKTRIDFNPIIRAPIRGV